MPKYTAEKLIQVRITPDAHRRLKVAAAESGMSFSAIVELAIVHWTEPGGWTNAAAKKPSKKRTVTA